MGIRNAKTKGKRLGRSRMFADAAQIRHLRSLGRSWRSISREMGIAAETAQKAIRTD
jgi:hypothetical protein